MCVGYGQTIAFLDSTLIRVPGYEPIYNHEIQPQEASEFGVLLAKQI